jgi:hypothetical protein
MKAPVRLKKGLVERVLGFDNSVNHQDGKEQEFEV